MIKLKKSEEELRELRDTLKSEIARYEVMVTQEISTRRGKIELINELLGEAPDASEAETINDNGKVKEEVVAA